MAKCNQLTPLPFKGLTGFDDDDDDDVCDGVCDDNDICFCICAVRPIIIPYIDTHYKIL